MRIGLIDVDSWNYPNLALMKISAWHKARGDNVEWWWAFDQYDRIYMSKIFDNTYTPDILEPVNAKEIFKGGTGYVLREEKNDILRIFHNGAWREVTDGKMKFGDIQYSEFLPHDIEHTYPDYSLYPQFTENTAYGFLTRGCPRGCHFCIVSGKEGRHSKKVANLTEWWNKQRNIVLMDPNLLACKQHMELLGQLIDSKAYVDVNQGFDARLLSEQNIDAINQLKVKDIHFAWDYMKDEKPVLKGLDLYCSLAKHKPHGQWGTVYVLTNYDTTMEENLYRIYTLRKRGFDPYVMIWDKPNAPKEIRALQRWCNNRRIFRQCPDFRDFDWRK